MESVAGMKWNHRPESNGIHGRNALEYARLSQIIGNPKKDPPLPPIIPVSRSTWWDGVKSGRFPRPVKLGPRITVWRVEDIRRLIQTVENDSMEASDGLDKNNV